MANCSCINITHSHWDFTSPVSKKVNDTTVDNKGKETVVVVHKSIIDNFDGIDKSEACSLKGLLQDLKEASFVRTNADEEAVVVKLLQEICAVIGEEEVVVNNGKEEKPKVIAEPEKVYGCLDPTASDYWCKIKGNDCVDDKPPKHVIDSPCSYSKELAVNNKYLFCNNPNGCGSDDTTDEGWITPNTDIATWTNNGAIDNDHIFQVQEGMKELVDKITPNYLFLKTKKGFYRQQFPESLKNELANALTVAVFKTKFKKDSDSTFPFTRLTVYSTDSKPMGQFSIAPKTGKNGEMDSITKIKPHTSTWHLNKRLQDEVGSEILDPNTESSYNRVLNDWDIRYTIKDGKVIKQQVNEGLGSLLQKEPIGLAKLLK